MEVSPFKKSLYAVSANERIPFFSLMVSMS